MNKSVWQKNEKTVHFDSLKKSVNTDVLIVGGGMAGILCAYELERAGVNYILAEAKEICSGVTENTTAKITFQHGLIYHKIIKKYGCQNAQLYLQAQKNAMEKLFELCKNIECDYEEKDSYVYSLSNIDNLENEAQALNSLGVNAKLLKTLPLPIQVKGAVKVEGQGQFNPLKFAYKIAEGLNIYENTKIKEFSKDKATTENGEINFKKAIITTHFPILNKHGGYFVKMYQHRSYVLALENAQDVDGMYVDESHTGMSFRNYKELLLLGGGGHRTGKTGGGWQELKNFSEKHYPNAKIVGKWATQDCMTLDSVPYIGLYSKSTPNLFVATGFNKWGMTSSMVSAMLLTDLIMEKENAFCRTFSPSRSIFHSQLAVNMWESLTGLLTPTVPRCSHLGCALKYNKQEHTWDCSCHGSRFSESGEVINNPATDDNNNIK